MSGDWFLAWSRWYVEATGADANAAKAVLANREVIVGVWGATDAELRDATLRLVAAGKVPSFANEHTNALFVQLLALRAEANSAAAAQRREAVEAAPACPLCGGSGWVSVPHPRCVWDGRLVCYPGTNGVVTVAVLCDLPDCAAGFAARDAEDRRVRELEGKDEARLRRQPRRPTYGRVVSHFRGLDVAELLREYERDRAERSRRERPAEGELAAVMRRLRAKFAPPFSDDA